MHLPVLVFRSVGSAAGEGEGGGGGVRAHPNCVQHPLPPEKLCYSIVIYIEKIDFRAHEILFKALLPSPEY